jgi:3-hydroxyacyl-CoA dehydrogenase
MNLVVETVGVVGSGVMGSGIAASLLIGGFAVVLCDLEDAALERARKNIADIIAGAAKRGRLPTSSGGAKGVLAKLSTSTDFSR